MKYFITLALVLVLSFSTFAQSLNINAFNDILNFSYSGKILNLWGSFSSPKGVQMHNSLCIALEKLTIGSIELNGPLTFYDKLNMDMGFSSPAYKEGKDSPLFGLACSPLDNLDIILSFPTRLFDSIGFIGVAYEHEDLFFSYITRRDRIREIDDNLVDYPTLSPCYDMDAFLFGFENAQDMLGLKGLLVMTWDKRLGYSASLLEKFNLRLGSLDLSFTQQQGFNGPALVPSKGFEIKQKSIMEASVSKDGIKLNFKAEILTCPLPAFYGKSQKRSIVSDIDAGYRDFAIGANSSLVYNEDLSRKAKTTLWLEARLKGLKARLNYTYARPLIKGELSFSLESEKLELQIKDNEASITLTCPIEAFDGEMSISLKNPRLFRVSYTLVF